MPVDPRHWFGDGPLVREGGGVRRRGRPRRSLEASSTLPGVFRDQALTAERGEGTGGPAGGTG